MIKCPSCRRGGIPSKANFCPFCGERLNWVARIGWLWAIMNALKQIRPKIKKAE